jgi:hypothetical protein
MGRRIAEWAIFGETFNGCLGGFVFACVVMLGERRRSIEALSWWRLAVWGFLAGVLVPIADTASRIARMTEEP